MRALLVALAFTVSTAAIHAPLRRRAGWRVTTPTAEPDLVAAKEPDALDEVVTVPKPPGVLQLAYGTCGLAMSSAWTYVVWTSIRSNQPLGAMMPSALHGPIARTGALSALPIIATSFATLASASKDSWESLGSSTCRRLNLALLTAGVGSALWVGFAPLLTQIPGSNPPVSHQSYKGATRAALIGAYGSAAALSAAVWVASLPEDVRGQPLAWPGRVADGVAKSLVSLAPASADDPVNVKYALLGTYFLAASAVSLGSFPLAVIPSWTGRRCSRAFVAWTLLAAAQCLSLKEAAERGEILSDAACRTLSGGLRAFGGVYLAAKAGAVLLDPSFPVHYGIVKMVPGYAAASAVMIGLTLRPDSDAAAAPSAVPVDGADADEAARGGEAPRLERVASRLERVASRLEGVAK